ncbi:hypothetical protein [Halalkalicoccus jeotgali]|uniref:Uncharacterized protein n=1 Tax=Halalkalicoccus jeotgali (strain DSM 18796 / CECT 7217 / JCM 14584 / KCTC 4019 / B3) TaxID=795797 RepID=D8J3G5_HALJB|nr:hypothetical protein [Halalkalicoccus jeotgali]ADJ15272.1 hypothetical protein HacjB3_09445 [Halalkalicoccus jeotgali B3]ELY35307.1 hypothetical protein C497_13231 [Halalkalicoccus jeotgali B3]
MKELEYAIEAADEGTFENVAAAFIRSRGYRTKEFRADTGEWSARIWMRSRPGIACASVAADWREALRASARKVKRIERERGEEYGLFVFVTNRDVTGLQEFDMEDEIWKEYGWRLRLYHRQDLIGELYNTAPGLAKHHLDINLGFDTDHLATLEELRDERLDGIRARDGAATELAPGPAVALHVVPNGIFSFERRWASSEIPDPSVLAATDTPAVDARETLKIAYDRDDDEYAGYGLIRHDGLYESATTRLFRLSGDELLVRTAGETAGLDAAVVAAVREALAALSSMGFSATASVWISVLDAADARLDHDDAHGPTGPFGFDRYSTRVATASIADREHATVVRDLEPALSELWRAFGHPDGTPNVEDGEWRGRTIPIEGGRSS